MFDLTWQNLKANLGRFLATVVAIVVGVAFLAAGLMFTDAIKDALGGTVEQQYARVDAQIRDDASRQAAPAHIPASVLRAVEALPQVEAAAGELSGPVGVYREGRRKPTSLTGRLWVDGPLGAVDVTRGRAPTATGEFVIDERSADDLGIAVGDDVRLATAAGERTAELVGLTRFGEQDAQDQTGTASFPAVDAFTTLGAGAEEYSRIIVDGKESVSAEQLRAALAPLTPNGAALTGRARFLEDAQGDTAAIADLLRPVLTGFSYLAIFVCGFVIANTFAVVLAQRVRELALIRAIGATPAQVRRSLRLEALAIGLGASLIGLAAGYGLAMGATALLDAFEIRLPGAGAKLTLGTVGLALVTGVLVTVGSVLLASRRAAKVAPVEAMSANIVEPAPKRRSSLWFVATVVGGAVLAVGGFAGNGWGIGAGALVFTVSLLRSSPLVLARVARLVVGATRGRSMATRLAAENIVRNPRRAAHTANALVIGVILISLVTTAGGTIKAQVVGFLEELSSTDLLMATDGTPFPDELVTTTRGIDGVDTVATATMGYAEVDGTSSTVATGDLADLSRASGLKSLHGSLAELGPGEIALVDFQSMGGGTGGLRLGQGIVVTPLGGEPVELKIGALIQPNVSAFLIQNIVAPETFEQLFGPEHAPSQAFITVEDGELRDVRERLEELTDGYSTVFVTEGNIVAEVVGDILDWIINAISGLLAVSVLIAVIGIVNTMTLAIIERRREIGLLRAVGMMPSETRRMVLVEALVIAVYGTIIGILAGVFMGFCLTRSLGGAEATDPTVGFEFEWTSLGVILAVGIVAGLVSAIIPIIRVSRTRILDALA